MTKANPRVDTTAAGQLLGYTLQLPRALCRLLEVGPGGAVGVEVLGDVTAYLPNGESINEEDKSSVSGNPLTDRSTDLWKTFHNWVKLIEDEAVDLDQTRFVLYCNQQGRKSLVDLFADAFTAESAEAARQAAEEELKGLSKEHDIWSYYDYVVNKHPDIFEQVITRFDLIIGIDSAYEDVRTGLAKMMMPDSDLEFVSHEMGGWIDETVMALIKAKKPAIIRHEDFKHRFDVLMSRIRQKELVDYAASELSLDEQLDPSVRSRPTFVRQLDLIDVPEEKKLEAVADYLRADYNRSRWIENEFIDEDVARDFDGKLQTFWQTTQRKIEIVHKAIPEAERGELVLGDCVARQELIRGVEPPDRTVSGTYHALSNRKELGWHPRWSDLLRDEEGTNDG
jgi:hypothetical protein